MKNYGVRFGSGDPRTYTGLTPTFLLFLNMASQTTVAPPGITEVIASSGLYTFQWGATTPIAFLIDANSTAPGNTGRYVTGTLDPADRSDEYGNSLMAYGASILALGTTSVALGTTNVALGTTNVALGTTNVALGTSNIALGTTSVSYGVLNLATGSSNIALGTTSVALGITNFAIGTSNLALISNNNANTIAYGNTMVALGRTGIAYGTTAVAIGTTTLQTVMDYGSTLTAIGLTTIFLENQNLGVGSTNVAIGTSITAQGVTLRAIGLTTLRLAQLTQSDTQALLLVTGELGDTLIAIGNTIAQGFSFQIAGIGSTASSFGDSTTMPTDLFGYLKRIQENLEGNSSYNKVGGAFTISSRGSSVVLASKTITNSVTTVIKT